MVKAVRLKVRETTVKDGVRLLMAFIICWVVLIIMPTIVESLSDMFAGII